MNKIYNKYSASKYLGIPIRKFDILVMRSRHKVIPIKIGIHLFYSKKDLNIIKSRMGKRNKAFITTY